MRTLLIAVLLIGTVSVAFAQAIQPKTLISSGGTHSAAGNVTMTSNLGEPIAGHSLNGSTEIWHGFYAPIPPSLVGVDNEPPITFMSFLGRVSPNPLRTSAVIEFGNAIHQRVELTLYDVTGRRVRQLRSGDLSAGIFRIPWDLRTDAGQSVPAGIYFVRLATRDFHGTRRMVVIR